MAKYLNKNLRFIRSEKGISQQELADKIGVDRSTISRIENNEIETTIDNALKIACALNVSLEDLTGKDLTNSETTFSEIEVLFSNNKDILTKDDEDYIKFIIEKRKKEIDDQVNN